MDEAQLRAILNSVINDERLAKADDVAKIHDKLGKHETKLTTVEEKLGELERRLENGQPRTFDAGHEKNEYREQE